MMGCVCVSVFLVVIGSWKAIEIDGVWSGRENGEAALSTFSRGFVI